MRLTPAATSVSTSVPLLLLIEFSLFLGVSAAQDAANPSDGSSAGTISEYYAGNVGIHYRLVRFKQGLGAQLTRKPVRFSPADVLRLQAGDVIIALNDQAIGGPSDLLKHFERTRLTFIDVRTGLARTELVQLPPKPMVTQPVMGYVLGVNVRPRAVFPPQPRPPDTAVAGKGAPSQRPIYGLEITWVNPGSIAQQAGLAIGDVIAYIYRGGMNPDPVSTPEALSQAIEESGGVMRLAICRDNDYRNLIQVTVDMR